MKTPEYARRCKCRDQNGRELGARCPQLRRKDGTWNPSHGSAGGRMELPPAPDGCRVRLVAHGFRTEAEMRDWFEGAARLLSIPGEGPEGHEARTEILALIKESRRRAAGLPDYDALRLRFLHGAVFRPGTTGEFLTAWLAERRQAGDLAATTLAGYESHITRIFLPAIGDVPLDKLGSGHISRCFAAIDARNTEILAARASADPAVRASVRGVRVTGPATKQRIRATLRSALSDATVAHLVTVNPAKLVRLGSGKRPKALVWTAERETAWRAGYAQRLEVLGPDASPKARFETWRAPGHRPSAVMVWTAAHLGVFLDAAADDRLYPLLHLIAFRGLRRGEACGLRWTDTDLEAGVITVLSQRVQIGWRVEESAPKTDASEADVAMDSGTIAVLRAWRKLQLEERLAWGGAWAGEGHVFTREDGAPLHPASVTARFEKIAFGAGLPPIRLHDLRHGAASLAFASGADMKAVQAMLRHSSMAITADTYTSVLPEVAADIAEKIAAIVPRQAAAGEAPGTAGLPSGSHGRTERSGFTGETGHAQVRGGGAPGARTLNPRIKSPLLCH
jgi:integrase